MIVQHLRLRHFKTGAMALVAMALAGAAVAKTASAPDARSGSKAAPEPKSSAEPRSSTELLSRLTKLEGFEAQFVERKQLALLKAPLETKGRLYYSKKGGLARKEEAPEAALVRVTESAVTIINAEGKKVIALSSHPEVAALAGSFLLVLSGNQEALLEHFSLTFEAATVENADHWCLHLLPNGAPLSLLVRSIEIVGSGPSVSRFKILETNGDVTVTELSQVNSTRKFSSEELESLFGLVSGKG